MTLLLYFSLKRILGGSPKVAKELFDMFGPSGSDSLTEKEVLEKLDSVLQIYREKFRSNDDESGEISAGDVRYYKPMGQLVH